MKQQTLEEILMGWIEIGFKEILTVYDGLDKKIILGRGKEIVLIVINYSTLEPITITLDQKTVEKMFFFVNEGQNCRVK